MRFNLSERYLFETPSQPISFAEAIQAVNTFESITRDPDAGFIFVLGIGTKSALQKRAMMRRVFEELGDDWQNPRAYDIFIPADLLYCRGHILKVIPHRFSMSLILDTEASKKRWSNAERNGTYFNGVHLQNSVFNLVKETDNPKSIQRTFEHEDLHSLVEEFGYTYRSLRPIIDELKARVERLKNAKEVNDSDDARNILRSVGRGINHLLYQGYDELLAELASTTPREAVPQFTWSLVLDEKKEILEKLTGEDDQVDLLMSQARKHVDRITIRQRIFRVYTLVEQRMPHRRQELEVAFALFPPEKMYEIEKLVAYWLSIENARKKEEKTSEKKKKRRSLEKVLSTIRRF